MNKESWIRHLEETTKLTRPSLEPCNTESWKANADFHISINCPECKARKRTRKANARARARHEAYTSAGMVRVRGAQGVIYYE